MQLNKEQVTRLKEMISKKGYPETDVQYEILDHVACKVEVLMEEDPKLSLPDAFQKVHASFGIFGFSELEESYKRQIESRLNGYFWDELKSNFLSIKSLIPIILTFCYFHFAFVMQNHNAFGKGWFVIAGLGLLLLFGLWWHYHFGRTFKKYKSYASWRGNQGILIFAYLPLQVMIQFYRYFGNINLLDPLTLDFWQIIGVCVVFVGFTIISVLPGVFNRSLNDTAKLEKLYASL